MFDGPLSGAPGFDPIKIALATLKVWLRVAGGLRFPNSRCNGHASSGSLTQIPSYLATAGYDAV